MYLIFDTETTDLPRHGAPFDDPRQPYIMQLGAVLVDREFAELDSVDVLVRIPPGIAPNPHAFAAHGITAEMCERDGIEPAEVVGRFNALARRADVIVAHNMQFDGLLWNIFCARHRAENLLASRPNFCTMERLTPIIKMPRGRGGAFKWPKLQEAHAFCFGYGFADAHDALADVSATARVLWWLVERGLGPEVEGSDHLASGAQRPSATVASGKDETSIQNRLDLQKNREQQAAERCSVCTNPEPVFSKKLGAIVAPSLLHLLARKLPN